MNPIAIQAGGAVLSGIGGALGDKAKSKAAKQRLKAMQKALQMYQIGSTDAYGNTLSADKNGRWNYNLSLPYKLQKISSDHAMKRLNEYKNLNPIEIQRKNSVGMTKALNDSAKASQGVAMSNALKQGSNIGTIATAFNRNRMANIQNSLLNAARSGQDYNLINTNNINALASNVNSIQQPINNMQNNLQSMVNSLNKTQMDQQNQIANAQYDKTLAGRMTAANMFTAAGGALSGYGANKQKQNNYDDYLATIRTIYGA